MVDKLTKEQAVIISAFTGILCCKFSDLHEYAEKILGRPVWSHEFGDSDFNKKLKTEVHTAFINILPVEVS